MSDQTRSEHHNPGCTGGVQKSRVEDDGRTRIRCRSCAAFWYVAHDDEDHPDINVVVVPIITARLVCSQHHDQPVTARGKGCTVCSAARQTWRDSRLSRRRSRRAVVE
jgi:hypothetical protein